jgi:hypothetical protein
MAAPTIIEAERRENLEAFEETFYKSTSSRALPTNT